MALDKLVDSTQLDADLTSVANAIRTKGGTSSQLAFPSGFVSAVEAIETGGGGGGGIDLSDIAQSTSLQNIGGLFTAFENGTWGSLEYSCVSGTNPLLIDFGRAIKGFIAFPKSIAGRTGTNQEQWVFAIEMYNDPDANGAQKLIWGGGVSFSGQFNGNSYGPRVKNPSLTNGVLSLTPNFPTNNQYHPFGFNRIYTFVYWW